MKTFFDKLSNFSGSYLPCLFNPNNPALPSFISTFMADLCCVVIFRSSGARCAPKAEFVKILEQQTIGCQEKGAFLFIDVDT